MDEDKEDDEDTEDATRCGKREVRRSEGGNARFIAAYDMSLDGGRGEEARYCNRSMRTRSERATRTGRAERTGRR